MSRLAWLANSISVTDGPSLIPYIDIHPCIYTICSYCCHSLLTLAWVTDLWRHVTSLDCPLGESTWSPTVIVMYNDWPYVIYYVCNTIVEEWWTKNTSWYCNTNKSIDIHYGKCSFDVFTSNSCSTSRRRCVATAVIPCYSSVLFYFIIVEIVVCAQNNSYIWCIMLCLRLVYALENWFNLSS